jgi:hypothetical protein
VSGPGKIRKEECATEKGRKRKDDKKLPIKKRKMYATREKIGKD